MPSEHLRFPGGAGHELAARLDAPDGEPLGWALFAHCFTCGKDLRAVNWLAGSLVAHGVGLFRFDFTGLGRSGGEFAQTTFSSNVDDLIAAADFMRSRGTPPRLLIGHSLGGAAVIVAAASIREASLVATIAAPAGTERFRERLLRRAPDLAQGGEAVLRIGPSEVRISARLLEDLAQQRLEQAVASLGRPLLVFHSPEDETVGIEQGERLFELAAQPKAFTALPGAGHLLLGDERDARLIGDVVAAWARRRLG